MKTMFQEKKLPYGAQPDILIYFINRITGKVGSTEAMVNRRAGLNGKDIISITYITTNIEREQCDIYLNEEEWLSDIKKLITINP